MESTRYSSIKSVIGVGETYKEALEDAGKLHETHEVHTWVAETDQSLIGFSHVLERGALHIDMPDQHAWLAFLD